MRVALRVSPGAGRNAIGPLAPEPDGGMALRVSVTAAPDRGRANEAVVKLLAKAWGVAKSRIAITAGAADRRKTVLVEGDPDELMERMHAWLDTHRG